MSKRIFRIESGRYGGEVVIGRVDKEFVDAMLEEDSEELIDTVSSADEEDFKGIVDLVSMLPEIKGIDDLAMTTNGILLDKFAQELANYYQ
mgnify:CR=1 FL=1